MHPSLSMSDQEYPDTSQDRSNNRPVLQPRDIYCHLGVIVLVDHLMGPTMHQVICYSMAYHDARNLQVLYESQEQGCTRSVYLLKLKSFISDRNLIEPRLLHY